MGDSANTRPTAKWVSALSRAAQPQAAVDEVVEQIREVLGSARPDLVMAFMSTSISAGATVVRDTLHDELKPECLAGVSAVGIFSSHVEIEEGPALAVMAGVLPGVQLHPFLLPDPKWFETIDDVVEFSRHAPGVSGSNSELLVLLGDPFSFDIDRVLRTLRIHEPDLPIVGGLASAGNKPGSNTLFLNEYVTTQGGIAFAMSGNIRADLIVSQGCQPVGPALEITSVRDNVIQELDGMTAAKRLQQVFDEASEEEKNLLRQGILVGRPARKNARGRGDYLIRNLLGHDPKTGALTVGDLPRERERVRLHARDADTAREDLELLLAPQAFDSRAQAALIFSCNSRGRNLYPNPNEDIEILQNSLGGSIPAAGFFCAGEIGPVGGINFLHGHTASIAILREKWNQPS